jgi:hypothetical protein
MRTEEDSGLKKLKKISLTACAKPPAGRLLPLPPSRAKRYRRSRNGEAERRSVAPALGAMANRVPSSVFG